MRAVDTQQPRPALTIPPHGVPTPDLGGATASTASPTVRASGPSEGGPLDRAAPVSAVQASLVTAAGSPAALVPPDPPMVPPSSSAGRGLVEVGLPPGFEEGLVEIHLDGRRLPLVRVGADDHPADRPVIVSFPATAARHTVRVHVLSQSARIDVETSWVDDWAPGDLLRRRWRLTPTGATGTLQRVE